MTVLLKVLQEAARLVEPSAAEETRVASLSRMLLSRTRAAASRHPETRGVVLGGSLAKGTWLPHNADIDIFVKFDPSTPEKRFEEVGLAVGAAATRGYPRGKKYAQHPYTEARVGGVRVNVVPCFDVKKGMWKSAADRSPFHVRLVKRLPAPRKTEIKLLKRFMKASGVYGAEIQTRGFSGYVAEVLAMNLGGLSGVLRWFADLRLGPEKLFSLPDPVDEGRYLGIAVSGEKLGTMVLAAREFLRSPNVAYFDKLDRRTRPSLRGNVVALVFSHRRLSEDTLWGELRRTTKHVVRHLEVHGFKVARSMAASNNMDKSAILLLPEFEELPELEQRIGPTVDRRKDVDAFISSNQRTSRLVWVDDDARVRLLRPRLHLRLPELLESVARGKAGSIGASKELGAGMKRSAAVHRGASLERAASSAKWLGDGIRELLSDAVGTGSP
ncbi:MAG: CCA tRNA nucleotidyltransferase [Thaumarchaeota archaeon]|nr:CCA tRNA nucleotidyltransferase [Nitrososphaerota archaeon]